MKRIYVSRPRDFCKIVLGLVIPCVVMLLLFSHWETVHTHNERQLVPKIRYQATSLQKVGNTTCKRDVLNQMTQGIWRKRNNFTSNDEIQVKEMDIKIRKVRGLPLVIHRDDMRCGAKFTLVGYNGFPSLCEANSSAPCCNHDEGRCGSGRGYCSCHGCTDFRKILSAELFEYIPSFGCAFKNFTSKEACKLMNTRVSNLTLVGDSLVRHFNMAMMILFTDDPREGSLRKNITDNERESCRYEFQFQDIGSSTCHGKTGARISDLQENTFCQGQYNFSYSYVKVHKIASANWAHNAVRENLYKSNSVVAIGVGIHMNFVFKEVKKDMESTLQLKKEANSEWPYIIWITTTAHGSLKPIKYLKTQRNDQIIRFNQQMREYLEPQGIPVFDIFNLTVGVKTYDGTHYGSGVNMIKAQLFMNFLEERFGK